MTSTLIGRIWTHFKTDTLFQNSIYLMLSTGAMAVFGFLFWLVCSHLFTPSDIGIATTLISAMTLISYISLLGFNNTFIRFLPQSEDKNNEINTGLLLSTLGAIFFATGYIVLIPHIAPKLLEVHDNLFFAVGFICIAIFSTLNLLTDSLFVAFRAAKYNLLIDGFILSLTKLALPFAFLGLGAYGVFAASGGAAILAASASVFFLISHFAYQPHWKIHLPTLRRVAHYSSANYIANLFNIAPILILPLVALNRLGSAEAGYYYLAFTIANLLYAVVYATSQALFAEGSHANQQLGTLVRKSIIVIGGILLPGALVLYVGAPIILLVFGKSYATEADELLRIFALAALPLALYGITNLILRIQKRVYAVIMVNIVYCVSISGLAYVWVATGLTGVGYAWLVGNTCAGLLGFAFLVTKRS